MTPKMNPYIVPGVLRNLNTVAEAVKNKSPDTILRAASQTFNVSQDRILNEKKLKDSVTGRFVVMFFLYRGLKMRRKTVADLFKYKNHSIIPHATKTVLNLWDTDKIFRKKIIEFLEKCEN